MKRFGVIVVLAGLLFSALLVAPAQAAPKVRYFKSPQTVYSAATAAKYLKGTPKHFKKAMAREGRKERREAAIYGCEVSYAGVSVQAYHRRGYAFGAVHEGCGGAMQLWRRTGGKWKVIAGGHEMPPCSLLKRHRVPASVLSKAPAGRTCLGATGQYVRYRHR